MNKFIGLLSTFALFIALSCSVNASDDDFTLVTKPTSYSRYGQFTPDYYDNYYGTQYVHYKPTYRPVVSSPYYDRCIPKNIIKSKDAPVENNDVFGTKPTYTPIDKSPYYNQNIPNSVKNRNSDANKSYGTYPWNVKYTYTPASQIKK